jgi:hypothetical protein
MLDVVKRIQDVIASLELAKAEVDQMVVAKAIKQEDILLLSGRLLSLMQITAGFNHSFVAVIRSQIPEGFVATAEPSEYLEVTDPD